MCQASLHLRPQSITAPAWPSLSTWTAPSSPRSSSATTSGAWWTQTGSRGPQGHFHAQHDASVLGGRCLKGERNWTLNVCTQIVWVFLGFLFVFWGLSFEAFGLSAGAALARELWRTALETRPAALHRGHTVHVAPQCTMTRPVSLSSVYQDGPFCSDSEHSLECHRVPRTGTWRCWLEPWQPCCRT